MRPGPPRTPLLLFPPPAEVARSGLETAAAPPRSRALQQLPHGCSLVRWARERALLPRGCPCRVRAPPAASRAPAARPLATRAAAAPVRMRSRDPAGERAPAARPVAPERPCSPSRHQAERLGPPRGARAGPRAWDTATLTASQGLSAVPRPRAQSQALPQSVRSLRGLGEPDPRREWSHGEPRDRLDGGVKGEVGQRRARMEKLRLLHLDSWALRRPGIHPFRGSRGEGGGECALTASVSRRGALSMRLRTDSLSYVWHPCHTCAASHPPSHHSVDLLSQKFFPTNPVCVHRCVRGWGVVGEPHSPKTTPQCEWADLERRQIRCPL